MLSVVVQAGELHRLVHRSPGMCHVMTMCIFQVRIVVLEDPCYRGLYMLASLSVFRYIAGSMLKARL
jgi:hypothetical protein